MVYSSLKSTKLSKSIRLV